MTVRISGKEYVLVSERVQACMADGGFSMVSEDIFSLGERHFLRVIIAVRERQLIGTAEIKFNAKPGSPDSTNPIECAQTSAVGRALGFAGYGVIESIASADEIVRNKPVDLAVRLKEVTARAKGLGIDSNEKWTSMLRSLEIGKVRSDAELDLIDAYLDQQQEKAIA